MKRIELTDNCANMHPHEFDQLRDIERVERLLEHVSAKVDEIIEALNESSELNGE